jgi:saccharopine dehydrogenase-like NADP-dependent oxidoreductase
MHKVLILGAGKIGRMVVHLLATSGDYQLRVGDAFLEAAEQACHGLRAATPLAVDFEQAPALDKAMKGYDAVISCAPFSHNPQIAARAKANGLHYFDLTEDVGVTQAVAKLARGARSAFMPQCGLAPGFITIVAHHLIAGMEEIRELRMRVGALPRHPTNRLKYNLTWSTEGLINEYLNPCDVLELGRLIQVPPLEQLERITVGGVQYEAFNTSGGVGTLAATLQGRARSVSYKTIRYPGHCDLVKFLLEDLQMRHHREELRAIFERSLATTRQDQVVVFVNAIGNVADRLEERCYANTILHQEIDGQPWTAIQVTTAAGVCAVVDLLLGGKLPQKGLVKQEQVALDVFLANRFGRYYAR